MPFGSLSDDVFMNSGLLFESLAVTFSDDFPDDFLMNSGRHFHECRIAFESFADDFRVTFAKLGAPRALAFRWYFHRSPSVAVRGISG